MHTPWGNWRREMLLEAGTWSAERSDNGDGLADEEIWDTRSAKRSRSGGAEPGGVAPRESTQKAPGNIGANTGHSKTEEHTQGQGTLSPESVILNERLLESMARTDELLT